MPQKGKKIGDRKDGTWLKDTDSMHVLFPHIMPGRADNEAVVHETIDLTEINRYLEEKNAGSPAFKYTFFHVICAILMKTMVLRPKLNRFYAGRRLYQRDYFSISFIVKKKFEDSSEEAVAVVKMDTDSDVSPLEQIHSKVEKICTETRKEGKNDGATDDMDVLRKLPRPLLTFVIWCLKTMDFFGLYPTSMMVVDPYFQSAFVSNLGSIKMNASYHHIANWGTNSFFAVVDEKKPTPFFNADGTFEVRDALNVSVTLDERIADGYYYSRSVALIRKLAANPWLLDEPITSPVEY